MNLAQLHERLRLEIARRIDRRLVTGTLLARQTGLQPSHISNFLHRRRKLSIPAIDRILSAQMISVEDLLPTASARAHPAPDPGEDQIDSVPLVSQATATSSAGVSAASTIAVIQFPAGILDQLRPRRAIVRRDWLRFLAVRISAAQAAPMVPVLPPESIVVVDRHYNSLVPHDPPRPSLYAVNTAGQLSFRYVSFDSDRLILRPHSLEYPVQILALAANQSPSSLIVGRVCVCISEL
jgi:hypothetical protein